jgi:glycosyltransferase involved in cell wall biosynthesis
MRIAQVAANVEPVPPQGYGGTELVVSLLTEELVKRGHEVTLFATGDSTTSARLISEAPNALRAQGKFPMTQWSAFDMRTLLRLQDMQAEFDIVHNHMSWTALPYLDSLDCAVLTTLHNQVKPYCEAIYHKFGHQPYVAISDSFKTLNQPDKLNFVATIYNGIKVDDFIPADLNAGREFLLFVGRICNDKGTAEAIDIAEKLNLPLKIAGKVDKNDELYFEKEVKPRLDSGTAEFIGEIGHEEKVKLYQGAIAVVYPINFNEPFGLVMAESLAAGTPVMAFDRGSVREILSEPETAIIGNSIDQLVEKFPLLEKISRQKCIDRVKKMFSVEKMVDGYEEVYANLLAGKPHKSKVNSR